MARTPMISAEMLVRREVHYCVSSLVSTLASSTAAANELNGLCDQAFALSTPVEDFEEAARQAGWEWYSAGEVYRMDGARKVLAMGWQEACEMDDLEPYQWDVFEHWIVSDWLADKLEQAGEKVDKDFAGLTVWARTTTGQAIAMDAVIQKITDELNAA